MSTPVFSLQVHQDRNAYYAVLESTTPDGPYRVNRRWLPSATWALAVDQVVEEVERLANWKGSTYRNVGRKPRNYWKARYAAEFLRRIGLIGGGIRAKAA